MPPVLSIFRDILLLRRGPQDLPYATSLLTITALLCIAVQLPLAVLRDMALATVLVAGIVWLLFTLGLLRLLLILRDRGNRFVQAATAFLGCNMAFNLVAIPIALLVGTPPDNPEQLTGAQILAGLISLPLLVWKVAVDAHVFRNSLDISYGGGLAIALMWILAAFALGALSGTPG
jgi:hypothetical protein